MFDKELVGKLYQISGILCPQHLGILNHIMGVTHVAVFLGHKLNQQENLGIDVQLVENAAMLHDIGKMFDGSPRGHVIEGVKFLRRQEVDGKIIRLVQTHQVWVFEEGEIPEPSSWEERLIFLADLTFQDSIIPVKELVKDLIERYSQHMPQGREKWLRDRSQEIYQKISEILSPQPLPF